MAHFPSIIPWINDMLDKDVDRDHFYTTFATIRFDVLVCLDTEPYEMLIGARGLNWACTLTISQNFDMQMDDYDFYSLKDKISPYLKHNGNQKFGSYIFLKYLCEHSPNKYRKKIINPSIVRLCAPHKATNINEPDRTVGCPNLILVEQQETMRKLSFTLVKTLRIIAENTIFHLNGLRKNKRKI